MAHFSDDFLLTTAPPEIIDAIDFCCFLGEINKLNDPIGPHSAWEVTLTIQYELEVAERYRCRALIGLDGQVCCFDRPVEYRN